jgi:hypothetical protein
MPFYIPLAASVAWFVLDIKTPNGVIDGFLYVSAVLLCHWVSNPRAPLLLAAGLMPAMALGFLASENASPPWMAITNRSVAMATVWIAAIVVSRHSQYSQQVASSLSETAQRLERSNRDALGDRTGIADWLREDVALELDLMDRRLHRLQHASWYVVDMESEAALLRRVIQRTKDSVVSKSLRLRGPMAERVR